ncbi:acyltransferase [Herbiconiux sp.]|uniref:acyltransferase family protein n=1 Tax=Herbiconiux sp. TaxID=1871186 RepID=UPI0025C11F8D|nr:acyltransferase [Herbiconiux sp.]
MPTTITRLPSLDGLRGLAALTVVLGHARLILLADPALALPGLHQLSEGVGTVGNKAVWLFFVLSGLVLTRFATGRPGFDYGAYLLSRLARLYIPVWAALAFTALSILIVPRAANLGLGQWIDAHPPGITPAGLVADATLVAGTSGTLSPLWTLQWEVLFSLLLVLYITVLRRVPPVAGVGLGIALATLGACIGSEILLYLPMFAIGVALALGWPRLSALARRLRSKGGRRIRDHPTPTTPSGSTPIPTLAATFVMAAGIALAVALCSLGSILRGSGLDAGWLTIVDTASALAGVTLVVVLVGLAPVLIRVFTSRPLHWLGAISFSIYLVHEPILVGAVRLFGTAPSTVLIALLLCFPAAALFARFVERPAHRFSQSLRRSPAPTRQDIPLSAPQNGTS